jgi:hypothetical protein
MEPSFDRVISEFIKNAKKIPVKKRKKVVIKGNDSLKLFPLSCAEVLSLIDENTNSRKKYLNDTVSDWLTALLGSLDFYYKDQTQRVLYFCTEVTAVISSVCKHSRSHKIANNKLLRIFEKTKKRQKSEYPVAISVVHFLDYGHFFQFKLDIASWNSKKRIVAVTDGMPTSEPYGSAQLFVNAAWSIKTKRPYPAIMVPFEQIVNGGIYRSQGDTNSCLVFCVASSLSDLFEFELPVVSNCVILRKLLFVLCVCLCSGYNTWKFVPDITCFSAALSNLQEK